MIDLMEKGMHLLAGLLEENIFLGVIPFEHLFQKLEQNWVDYHGISME